MSQIGRRVAEWQLAGETHGLPRDMNADHREAMPSSQHSRCLHGRLFSGVHLLYGAHRLRKAESRSSLTGCLPTSCAANEFSLGPFPRLVDLPCRPLMVQKKSRATQSLCKLPSLLLPVNRLRMLAPRSSARHLRVMTPQTTWPRAPTSRKVAADHLPQAKSLRKSVSAFPNVPQRPR